MLHKQVLKKCRHPGATDKVTTPLTDQYLLMERGEFIMRGKDETMLQDGVREALAV